MSNIFQDLRNFVGNVNAISSLLQDDLGRRYGILGAYYEGDHVPQLKTKNGQNDNIITNHLGVNINRSVSRMFRGGIKFNLPEGAEAQQEYIDKLWDLNKKEILLFQWGLYGAVHGTAYMKIIPDALDDPLTGELDYYPRLVALYPDFVRIKTDPKDADSVLQYRIEWSSNQDGKDVTYREDTDLQDNGFWLITNYVKVGSRNWEVEGEPQKWNYDFPPILHNKNLPSLNNVYGQDEESDAIGLQNKYNFVQSNTGKITKHHAHPRTVFIGVSANEIQRVDDSPDSALAIPNAEAKAMNLEMQSDLVSSRAFANDLQKSIASVMREIDIPSISDKLGALTNFALRVLYTDAIDKNDTKRQLYGDALKELNRRLLVIKGFTAEATDPGNIHWGEAIIINIAEEIQSDKALMDMGVVDAETIYGRYESRYSMSWEDVKARMDASKQPTQTTPQDGGAPQDANTRASFEGGMKDIMQPFLDEQKKRILAAAKSNNAS